MEAAGFSIPTTIPVMGRRSDRGLVERFRMGDERAFELLYTRHRARVQNVCRGILGNGPDADDAAQETFARAAVALRRSAPEEPRAWLLRIARNTSIDLARARRPVAEAREDEPALGNGTPGEAQQRSELRELVVAIGELPHAQREALVLRELAGWSYAEIARDLGTDVEAVRGLIARARVSLRERRGAADLECSTVREELARELDGRRRCASTRRHLRLCSGCRDYQAALRRDRRAIRSLVPGGAVGLGLLLAGLRPGRVVLLGGAIAKGLGTGAGAAQLVALAAFGVGTVEGVRTVVTPAHHVTRAQTRATTARAHSGATSQAGAHHALAATGAAASGTAVNTGGAGSRVVHLTSTATTRTVTPQHTTRASLVVQDGAGSTLGTTHHHAIDAPGGSSRPSGGNRTPGGTRRHDVTGRRFESRPDDGGDRAGGSGAGWSAGDQPDRPSGDGYAQRHRLQGDGTGARPDGGGTGGQLGGTATSGSGDMSGTDGSSSPVDTTTSVDAPDTSVGGGGD